MIKKGTGKCWNPIPVNTWNLVIASNDLSLILPWPSTHYCIRLLGVSRFRPRFHPGRYRVEAADETVEEILAESSAINGCFVCVFHLCFTARLSTSDPHWLMKVL